MITRFAVLLIGAFGVTCANERTHAQGVQNDLGFSSPEAALQALKARTDVEISEQNDWTVASDRKNLSVWLPGRPCVANGR